MQIAMLAAALLLLVVWTGVGLRMLLLARRTGGVPELTLGLGLFVDSALIVLAQESAQAAIAVVTSASGSLDSVFLWLAFFPPKPYTHWIAANAQLGDGLNS